jgi:leucyl-tRNA synthetase
MILGENGEKMSKSRGNVINPDDIVGEIGADAFRVYEMFMGAFDQAIPWSTKGAKGCHRFLERVWRLQDILTAEEGVSDALKASVHETIKKVSEDYEKMKFNTAIAAMMALVNDMYSAGSVSKGDLGALVKLLYPVAPHICEEIWEKCALGEGFAHSQKWPEYDPAALVKDEVELAVQICGKFKGTIALAAGLDKDAALAAVKAEEKFAKQLEGKTVVKEIVVPDKLINIVVR